VAVHVHLARQRALGGAGAERLARGLPVAVVLAFEVGDEDVVLGAGRRNQQRESGDQRHEGSDHGFLNISKRRRWRIGLEALSHVPSAEPDTFSGSCPPSGTTLFSRVQKSVLGRGTPSIS